MKIVITIAIIIKRMNNKRGKWFKTYLKNSYCLQHL